MEVSARLVCICVHSSKDKSEPAVELNVISTYLVVHEVVRVYHSARVWTESKGITEGGAVRTPRFKDGRSSGSSKGA